MPTTKEWDVKVALAKQAGDEARHFSTLSQRMEELKVSLESFQPPPTNPLFEFLRGLPTTVERIAAGMVTLESIAYRVNDQFLKYCEKIGDEKTAAVYRDYIQPVELAHHRQGQRLLEKYAVNENLQALARAASQRTLEISRTLRSAAALRLGTACFPGC
jgi:hypothetical protein